MSEIDFVLEPVHFFGSPLLLSGAHPEALPADAEIVTDLERAMILENEQDLPAGYAIWLDAYAAAKASYFSTDAARDGEKIAAEAALRQVSDIERLEGAALETEFYEFWDTVAGEIIDQLNSIAISRFVLGQAVPKFFADLFQIYRAGFYPCGLREDGGMVAFDPKALGGFDLVAAARRRLSR
ncbi:hypothetical protein [Paracoccus cavernae]|uniref:hypothetical protein n=1 Tax=Paracoccus cavernae TaxID=1571207 RepID=UPI0035F40414